jgi:hypothetical protein
MLAMTYMQAKRRAEDEAEDAENLFASKANRPEPTFFATRPVPVLPAVNTITNTWAIPNREF